MSEFKIIIIGGGLAGALLANGLMKNDVKVMVYERDKEQSKREGYQIRLGEPSLKGFQACLTPDHIKTIEEKFGLSTNDKVAHDIYTAPCVYNTSFTPILDLGRIPSYSASTAINRVVLSKFLVDPVRARGCIAFDKAFSHYSIVQDSLKGEKIRVHFNDGSSDVCDVLIGADGSGSKINRQIGLCNIRNIDTHWAFISKGTLSQKRVEQLPKRLQQGPILLFQNGITLYYALYMPAKQASDTESNVLFNYDETEASFYWNLLVPKHHFSYESQTDIVEPLQACLQCVQDWAPEFTTMLSVGSDDREGAGVGLIPLRASTKPSHAWRKVLQETGEGQSDVKGHPRVWLIGDAMHAMQPNRGMGGNQSMYDCTEILPPLLKLNALARSGSSPSTDQVHKALQDYEPKMMDRAFRWVVKSGGTSVPNVNTSGIIGLLLIIVNSLVLPVLSAFAHSFETLKHFFT